MKYLLTILTLLPLFISAQNISVKSFNLLSDDLDARVNYAKSDQNGDKCALIKLVTTEKGFMFEGDMNGIVDTEYKTGEYWIYLPYGSKKITLKHDKLGVLRNYVYPIPIKEATVYEMILVTAKITTVVEEIKIPMQWLTVSTYPEEADFYLNEKYMGTTPFSKKMEIGKYNYRIEKSMHHSTAGIFELTEDKKTELTLNLKPNYGFVQINTTPETGARIEIDGKSIDKKTPFKSESLSIGKHKVQLKKYMFQPKTVEFEITEGQTTILNVELKPNYATINVTTSPSADIYIDGIKEGTGTFKGRLMPGLHTFEAKKDKYRTDLKQQEIFEGDNINISLHPLAKTGSVDVTSSPFGASIKIDGKEYGTTPNTINNLLIGDHTLEIEKIAYASVTKRITITENKTTTTTTKLFSSNLSLEDKVRMADSLIKIEEWEKSHSLLSDIVLTEKKKEVYWQQLILLDNQLMYWDKMVIHSEESLKHFPNNSIFIFFAGFGMFQTENYQRAVEYFLTGLKKISKDDPLYRDYRLFLAEGYYKIGEKKLCINIYEEIVKADPDNIMVLNNYAYYLSEENMDLKKAENWSKKTLKKDPNNATYLDTYAWILFKIKKYSDALEYIEKAIANDDNPSSTIYEHYGDILYHNQQKNEALTQWEKAKSLGSESKTLRQKIELETYVE